jgi:glycosyltransferase involved in cell wall biosynthesis
MMAAFIARWFRRSKAVVVAIDGRGPQAAPPPIHGHIDQPKEESPVARDFLVVRGWAVGTQSPVSRVEVRLDGRWQGCAGLGRPRPDVAAALQNEDAELSGFELRLDTSRLGQSGQRLLLEVSVILLDGTRAALHPVEIAFFANDPRTRPVPEFWKRTSSLLFRPPSQQGQIRLLCFARSLDRGGSQLRMRELIQHLQSSGRFECTIVTPADGPLRRDLEAAGAKVKIALIPMDDAVAYEQGLKNLAIWATDKFDVVLAFTLTSFAGVDLAWQLGLPSVWRIGESESLAAVIEWLGGRIDPAIERRANAAFDLASRVFFISQAAFNSRRQRGSPGRFVVGGNGVDVAAARGYMLQTNRDACRQMLGFGPEQRVLICAATLWPIKGQDLLVSAMKHIRRAHPELICVLIGQFTSPYAEALSRFVSRHQLADHVRIVPFCDDLRPWRRAADAAVCPSESEAMPTSTLEAMAFGLPVLASRTGGNPEVVEEGVTGWLCEPSDLTSLINGLDRIAGAGSDQLREFGDEAQRRVSRTHDRAEALAHMTAVLTDLCRTREPTHSEVGNQR